MATLRYVGQNQAVTTSDPTPTVIAPKSFADTRIATAVVNTNGSPGINVSVTPNANSVTNAISSITALLAPLSHVTAGDSNCTKIADFTAADTNYIAASRLNHLPAGTGGTAIPGIAGLDGSGNLVTTAISPLTTGQVPSSVLTERVHTAWSVGLPSGSAGIMGGTLSSVTHATGTPGVTSSGNVVVTAGATSPQVLATVIVNDPGYPYLVFPFAWVFGHNSATGSTPTQTGYTGNGIYGLLTARDRDTGLVYGYGKTTGNPYYEYVALIPAISNGATPGSSVGLMGTKTFQLIGDCTTSTYTWLGTDMSFWVLVAPAY